MPLVVQTELFDFDSGPTSGPVAPDVRGFITLDPIAASLDYFTDYAYSSPVSIGASASSFQTFIISCAATREVLTIEDYWATFFIDTYPTYPDFVAALALLGYTPESFWAETTASGYPTAPLPSECLAAEAYLYVIPGGVSGSSNWPDRIFPGFVPGDPDESCIFIAGSSDALSVTVEEEETDLDVGVWYRWTFTKAAYGDTHGTETLELVAPETLLATIGRTPTTDPATSTVSFSPVPGMRLDSLSVTFAWETPEVEPQDVTRLWPRDDALGLGAGTRLVPAPRSRRVVGGHQ